jgi:diguanylate cyclase (GGDEF)-like protein
VEAHDFPHGERQPLERLSVSIGLASYPTDAADVGTLFEAADRALYLAKKQGRNRVEVYRGPQLSTGSDAA